MSWLARQYALDQDTARTVAARLRECDGCKHQRGHKCMLFNDMRDQVEHLKAGDCSWRYVNGNIYSLCTNCEYLRPNNRCSIFSAGCDAKSRRMAVLISGECSHRKQKQRLDVRYHGPEIPQETFVRTTDLIQHAQELATHIPWEHINGIIGIARSGLIAASAIAAQYHVPLWSISPVNGQLKALGSGYRLGDEGNQPSGRLLLMDDTASNGGTMAEVRRMLERTVHSTDIYTAAIYASHKAAEHLDFVARIYPQPHYLEWCVTNTFWSRQLAYDMDGIICNDPEWYDCSQEYRAFLHDARPLYLPKMFPIVIISARAEWTREATKAWLDRYGVRVRELVLWPGDPQERWVTVDKVAKWKAEQILRLKPIYDIRYYIESDPQQAEIIAQVADMPVICPAAGRVFKAGVL